MSDDSANADFRETLRIMRDDPEGAIGRLRGRIMAGTADYRTYHNLAVALGNSHEFAGALEAVRTSLGAAPESTITHFLHGVLSRGAGRYEEALAAFAKVEELDADYPRLHADRGIVHFFTEDEESALADLRIAVTKDPEDAATLFNLAVVLVSRKRFGEAQQSFQRLIELEPEKAGYYHQFLVELGRVEVTEETLTQAHRIKNFMGIVGDRLRSFCDAELEKLEGESAEDLLAIREDYERIYADLVVFLRAIRPRPMRLEKVNLTRLIDRVMFVASDKVGGTSLEREIEDELPEITCDIEMVQEAILNVVLNALDAIGARFGEDAPEGRLIIRGARHSESVNLEFEDNGGGIAPGDLERIFKFGFTTKSLGTGIGLSFTRRVCEDHGGSIRVESEDGVGTKVQCTIPITPTVSASLANLALRSQLFHDPRELILEEGGEDLGI